MMPDGVQSDKDINRLTRMSLATQVGTTDTVAQSGDIGSNEVADPTDERSPIPSVGTNFIEFSIKFIVGGMSVTEVSSSAAIRINFGNKCTVLNYILGVFCR